MLSRSSKGPSKLLERLSIEKKSSVVSDLVLKEEEEDKDGGEVGLSRSTNIDRNPKVNRDLNHQVRDRLLTIANFLGSSTTMTEAEYLEALSTTSKDLHHLADVLSGKAVLEEVDHMDVVVATAKLNSKTFMSGNAISRTPSVVVAVAPTASFTTTTKTAGSTSLHDLLL